MSEYQITGANAGGPPLLAIRAPWAARIAQFWRWLFSFLFVMHPRFHDQSEKEIL